MALIADHTLQDREIRFRGVNLNNTGKSEENSFTVLAGDPIVATEGYAKYAHVPRPQRKSMTILEGYEPMTIVVPVLFDSTIVATRRSEGEETNVEKDLQLLEWMGGRGVAFKTPQEGGIATPGEGNSPLITLESYTDPSGVVSALVPLQYQTATLLWFVTGLEFDKTPGSGVIREAQGNRTRQAVTITLTEVVQTAFETGRDSPASRAKAREIASKKAPKIVHAKKPKEDTLQGIATYYCHNVNAVNELIAANKGNKAIGSNPTKPLREGTSVKVPITAIKVAPHK